MAKRASRSKPPPPATPQEAAARMLILAIQECDRKDGSGVDWAILAGGLFHAGFEAAKKLDDPARIALLTRVHAFAYERITAKEDSTSLSPAAAPRTAPAAAKDFNQPTPKGPK